MKTVLSLTLLVIAMTSANSASASSIAIQELTGTIGDGCKGNTNRFSAAFVADVDAVCVDRLRERSTLSIERDALRRAKNAGTIKADEQDHLVFLENRMRFLAMSETGCRRFWNHPQVGDKEQLLANNFRINVIKGVCQDFRSIQERGAMAEKKVIESNCLLNSNQDLAAYKRAWAEDELARGRIQTDTAVDQFISCFVSRQ